MRIGLLIAATDHPAEARQKLGRALSLYGRLPCYRAMLDREGVAGPADVALVGSEAELVAQLARLAELGVTDFAGAIARVEAGAHERTLALLASELGAHR
jgi:hypothetical protein